MRVEFYGLVLETPRVTVHMWSPWRCSALEHRLFDAVENIPGAQAEEGPDEFRLHLNDAKIWRQALLALIRVLKGWQEEADPGQERRGWRWLMEGDADANGYDHTGEPAGLWVYLRLSLERGSPEDGDKGEDIDLHGLGIRVLPTTGQG